MCRSNSSSLLNVSKYASYIIVDSRSKMIKFLLGVSSNMVKECKTAMLIKEMDISKLIVLAQQIEELRIKKKRGRERE